MKHNTQTRTANVQTVDVTMRPTASGSGPIISAKYEYDADCPDCRRLVAQLQTLYTQGHKAGVINSLDSRRHHILAKHAGEINAEAIMSA